jgi:hypothetical protein
MRSLRFIVTAAAFGIAAFLLQPFAQAQAAGLLVGGFDKTRGGIESLQNNPKLKHDIEKGFPGTTFRFTKQLSNRFFGGLDVVVLGVSFGGTTPITSLTANEQTALLAFVQGGGTAIVLTDNNLQFSAASNSMLAPFGMHANGVLDNAQTANFLDVTDPIKKGPFGNAAQLDYSWPGWFDTLGGSTELADLAGNNMPALAYFPAGTISTSSGAAVFFSDSSSLLDTLLTRNDRIATLNAIALACGSNCTSHE